MASSLYMHQLKQTMRETWMAGDFSKIARANAREAEEFAGRLGLSPSAHVLDLACGTGNVSIPLARLRARVTGVDIAPNLLAQARERAAAADHVPRLALLAPAAHQPEFQCQRAESISRAAAHGGLEQQDRLRDILRMRPHVTAEQRIVRAAGKKLHQSGP